MFCEFNIHVFHITYLPLATKLRQGYVFFQRRLWFCSSRACMPPGTYTPGHARLPAPSTHAPGHAHPRHTCPPGMHTAQACMLLGMHAPHTPQGMHAPPPGTHTPSTHAPGHAPPPAGWSMRGRYASCWNAILFLFLPCSVSSSVLFTVSVSFYGLLFVYIAGCLIVTWKKQQ